MQSRSGGFSLSISLKRAIETGKVSDAVYQFTSEGESLLIKAIHAAIQSSIADGGKSKIVPLHGIVDLKSQKIYIGSLGSVRHDRNCVDVGMLCFTEEPCFEHKKPGLFESGCYSPRIMSYQKKYSAGPTAHQQLLFYATKKLQVSADDAQDKRGFAFQISVIDQDISLVIDGNSLSINETAQYLRVKHQPKHTLTDDEANNNVLKASKEYSPLCEDWILKGLAEACTVVVDRHKQMLTSYSSATSAASASSVSPFI